MADEMSLAMDALKAQQIAAKVFDVLPGDASGWVSAMALAGVAASLIVAGGKTQEGRAAFIAALDQCIEDINTPEAPNAA